MEEKLLSLATEQKILLAAVGFLLTTVLGGALGFLLNGTLWKTQTEHAIYRASFDEGVKFLDELSELIGRRFFLLQRLLWAIQDEAPDRVNEAEVEYFIAVRAWNYRYWRYRNKIRLLVSERDANEFLDYNDDGAGDQPHSIHYLFILAHRKVMACMADPRRIRNQRGTGKLDEASLATEQLNWACSRFLEHLTTEFLKKAAALQLLQVPVAPGGAELAARRRSDMTSLRVRNS